MKPNDLSPDGCGVTALGERCDATLPDNPRCTLNYHFGMLLGADDFQAEQGFHLGRSRRHQRLLHGSGVVAGYPVSFQPALTELRVGPGLAVDALGRDLALDQTQCVNLVKWWLQHQKEEAFADLPSLDDATFDLDVVVCYSTCLSSPVPAIAEPCAGQASDIAYSRVCETVTLQLVRAAPMDAEAAPAPAPGSPPASAAEGNCDPAPVPQPPVDLPWPAGRAALAEALAAQSIAPPDPIDSADLCLPLARLRGLHLQQGADGWTATVGRIDLAVRPLLLATGVLQNLLSPALATPAYEAGPAVVGDEPSLAPDDLVTLRFDQALAPASVQPEAFAVSEFDATTGWSLIAVSSATYTAPGPLTPATVALQLARAVTGALLRVAVIGTGSTPLLGEQLIPAGAPHPRGDGRVTVITLHRG
jgi:hypothetical protein